MTVILSERKLDAPISQLNSALCGGLKCESSYLYYLVIAFENKFHFF